MERDETGLFDPDDVRAAAEAFDVEFERLTAVIVRHQHAVEDLPGVENIVYEWRKQYEDPLLARTETAYYLRIPRAVWEEFDDAIEVGDETLAALIDVHRRTVASECDAPADPPASVSYVALDRTIGDN
jgi:hypothetical protein